MWEGLIGLDDAGYNTTYSRPGARSWNRLRFLSPVRVSPVKVRRIQQPFPRTTFTLQVRPKFKKQSKTKVSCGKTAEKRLRGGYSETDSQRDVDCIIDRKRKNNTQHSEEMETKQNQHTLSDHFPPAPFNTPSPCLPKISSQKTTTSLGNGYVVRTKMILIDF